jgi:hypothetical protein
MLGRQLATDLQKLPPMSLGIYPAVATSAPKHVLGFRYNRGAFFFSALKVPIDVVHVHFLRLTAAAQTSRTLQSVCSGRSKVDKAVSNLKPSEHPAGPAQTSARTLSETGCAAQPVNGPKHVFVCEGWSDPWTTHKDWFAT